MVSISGILRSPEQDLYNLPLPLTSPAIERLPQRNFLTNILLASELLQHNVIALVEGTHTKIPACAFSTITNIPLIHLHGNHPTLERCAKAIQLSADYKDYAHASLDIINSFHWKNIAMVTDGKEHRLYYYCIILFDHWFIHLFVCSCVCVHVVIWSLGRLFVCACVWEAVCLLGCFVFGRLFLCSPVRVVDCLFGLLVFWSFVNMVILFGCSFGRFFVCLPIRYVYFLFF